MPEAVFEAVFKNPIPNMWNKIFISDFNISPNIISILFSNEEKHTSGMLLKRIFNSCYENTRLLKYSPWLVNQIAEHAERWNAFVDLTHLDL